MRNSKKIYSLQKIPILDKLRDFFGLYVILPFEKMLLDKLLAEMCNEDRGVLEYQLNQFLMVKRVFKHLDVANAHGFTNFYTYRFGRNLEEKYQKKRFSVVDEELLAKAKVCFEGGEINVSYYLLNGVFFCIDYRSSQKIYYPTSDFSIESFEVWPNRNN